jgi:hypothetical protein
VLNIGTPLIQISQQKKVIKQSPLEDKEAYLRECGLVVNKKRHNIVVCPKEEASKQVCQN